MTAGVTPKFRAAYEQSHIVSAGGILATPEGTPIGRPLTFQILAANSVKVDVTAANRRSCTLALLDPDGTLAPIVPGSPLALINEISLYRGIRFDDGTSEPCPLGVFGIQTALSVGSAAGPIIAVTAIDRSKRLDVNLSHGRSFLAGTPWSEVFSGLSDESGIVYEKAYGDAVVSSTSPALVFNAGDNIWQQIQTAASSLGCWAYFDTAGVFTVIEVPDPDGQPIDWEYGHGANAMFVGSTRQLALEDGSQKAYSHAVVTSQVHGTNAPLRSDAFDNNPLSPTYYLGPFGDRPVFDSNVSSFVSTQAQCDAAAAALLRRNYGLLERVTLQAAPNPALEGGDVVQIADPNTDTNGVYISESFEIPLFASGGLTSITFRSRQLH